MEIDSPPATLESHLGYWLRFVSNSVSAGFANKLEAHGVSVAEWVAMRLIHGHTDVLASAIAGTTGMTRGAISKIVDRLEARGLIDRKRRDGRGQILRLTIKGGHLLPLLAALADQNDVEFFAHLTAKERAEITRILKSVVTRSTLKNIPVD